MADRCQRSICIKYVSERRLSFRQLQRFFFFSFRESTDSSDCHYGIAVTMAVGSRVDKEKWLKLLKKFKPTTSVSYHQTSSMVPVAKALLRVLGWKGISSSSTFGSTAHKALQQCHKDWGITWDGRLTKVTLFRLFQAAEFGYKPGNPFTLKPIQI